MLESRLTQRLSTTGEILAPNPISSHRLTSLRFIDSRYDAHADILAAQFSRPTNGGLTPDGYSDFFNFSTGRRVVASLHTVFSLRPRHDPFQLIFQFLYGFYDFTYSPSDVVTLDLKLDANTTAPEGVFAVVRKEELKTIKRERWDLVSNNPVFYALVKSPLFRPSPKRLNIKIFPPLSVLCRVRTILRCPPDTKISQHSQSEFADIFETIFKEFGNYSLIKVLNDPKILPYLVSLSITDQPAERPTLPEERERHVIVKLSIPSGSQVNDTREFVASLFQLVDIVGTKFSSALRPDTKSKLRKVREDLDKQLRVEATKEQKGEVRSFPSTPFAR